MKQLYAWRTVRLFAALLLLFSSMHGVAQCPLNATPLTLQRDTIEQILTGNSTSTYSIPRFNPALGTLVQVEIRAVITGVVRMRLENDVGAPASYRIRYTRNDDIAGPGLAPNLLNNIIKNYGPYGLAASDGNLFSGPDYISIGPDTVLRNVIRQRFITTALVNFMGAGNLLYTYRVNASTVVTGSSNYIFTVATTGRIVFSVVYTYCPVTLLPTTLLDFSVKKTGAKSVALAWATENDYENNHYDIEVSRDGNRFRSIGNRKGRPQGTRGNYLHDFYAGRAAAGRFYFRVGLRNAAGSMLYTPVREINLSDETSPQFAVYPNPVSEALNIEFAQEQEGICRVQVISLQGQIIYDMQQRLQRENTLRLALNKWHRPGKYVLKIFGADGKAHWLAHVQLN
jgi:Secretion system C-terminal sorting domain